jgi:glycolate dehydrogenase FAD-linked subunit
MGAIDELVRDLPAEVLTIDPEVMAGYRRDRADLVSAGRPAAVARPVSTDQVSQIMGWAWRHGVTVVPRGAGTGLAGGANAIDGCIIVCLERMTTLREINPVDQLAVVEAGVINADLERAARQQGMFYPPDPGSFEISTIGGNVATNAGGTRCVKYGVTRDSVLGLEVVLADGRILRTGARSIKNVAGLDLTSLFIGSEGTLGIITAATVRLRPAPATPPAVVIASFPTLPSAGDAVAAIAAAAIAPSMLELIDHETINAIEDYRRMDLDRSAAALLIGQADGPDALRDAEQIASFCEEAGADFSVCTQDPQEADALIAARRLAGLALLEIGPTVIEDIGVPRSRLPQMLAEIEQIASEEKIRIATVGHAGDGNLHPALILGTTDQAVLGHALAVAERICRAALAHGGTVTGEHGVGVLKRSWLAGQLDDTAIDVHNRIKAALDPRGLLNPGRGW